MSVHAVVDESQGGRYLICTALVEPQELAGARGGLRAIFLTGQRRLHLAQERPQQRR